MNEREYAVMEGELNRSSQAYFEARPSLDTKENRRLFEAGFQRGYDVVYTSKVSNRTKPVEHTNIKLLKTSTESGFETLENAFDTTDSVFSFPPFEKPIGF